MHVLRVELRGASIRVRVHVQPRKQPCVRWRGRMETRHDGAQPLMTHVMLVGGDVALLEGLA
ncbi:MAG: hypothetical protein M3Z10_02520, partial [Gemmatimonadota bacterium]|nr:hypothetical protein [Gemmatimonadota bacterium]